MDKRTLRKRMGQSSWALLVYYGLLNAMVFLVMEIALVYEGLQGVIRGGTWSHFIAGVEQAAESVVYGNGWGYLAACALAVVLIPMWKGMGFFQSLFETKRAMTGKTFLSLLCLFISGQLLVQVIAVVAEIVLNLFGLSVMQALQMATVNVDTLSMFLYMGLGAPIVEELVFRGVILRMLEPFGKRFAIVASSILFGLFHGNLVQSPYAFAVGLVLGYAAMEYSITWAMVLHMVNNLVMGDMLLRVTSGLPGMSGELAIWMVIFACFVASVVIIFKNRYAITFWRKEDPIRPAYMKAFAWSLPNLILYVLMGVSAVSMLWI